MPRQQANSIKRTSVDPSSGTSSFTQVTAAPVATAVLPNPSTELTGLLDGLAQIEPQLRQKMAKVGAEDKSSGRQNAISGGSKSDAEEAGGTYLKGFLIGEGEAAAITDQAGLIEEYQTDFDKDNGDFEGFLSGYFDRQMQGAPDDEFREGYEAVFHQAAQGLRKEHHEEQAKRLIENNLANAQARVDYVIENAVRAETFTPKILDRIESIGVQQNVSFQERNDMLYRSLLKYSNEGHSEVWKMTKMPRRDPVTGEQVKPLYNVPEFKEKIDRAETAAFNIAIDRHNKLEAIAKKDRTDAQSEAMLEVFNLALTDPDAARRRIVELAGNRKLFTNAHEIQKVMSWANKMVDDSSEDPTDERDYYIKMAEGTPVSVVDIMSDPKLSRGQSTRVLARLRSEESAKRARGSEQRTLDNEAEKNEAANTPEFKDDMRYLKGIIGAPSELFYDPTKKVQKFAKELQTEILDRWVQVVRQNPEMPRQEMLKLRGELEVYATERKASFGSEEVPEKDTAARLLQEYQRGIISKDQMLLRLQALRQRNTK